MLVDERDENFKDDGSLSSEDSGTFKKGSRNPQKARILEIIEERPSIDVQINDDVYKFLRSIELEFLAEHFSGDYSKLTITQLKEMSDDKLEEILEGSMYVKRIRNELQRQQDHPLA